MPSYDIPHNPKMVHEAMCVVQHLILSFNRSGSSEYYAEIVGDLIRECERKRPLGSNGKHGDRHTAECGCEDKPDYDPDTPWWLSKHEGTLMREIYQGKMERPYGIKADWFRDYLKFFNKKCPRCNGLVWNETFQIWVATRETTGMICELCGTDYSKENH